MVAGAAALIAPPAGAAVPSKARIATLASDAMNSTGAKGLAIALIDNGRVVSVQAFGARNAKGDPLTVDTVMYGASLTKAVFGYYSMMLVDEGRLKLDQPVASMLPRPLPDYGNLDAYGNWGDLARDDRWERITARHILTHSTGFANFSFIEPDGKLKFHFAPGARYAYSGEGIILLQFALEKGQGIDVGADVQRRIFTPLGMNNTSLMWRPDFARNLADGWKADGSIEPHDERSRARAAGSMDTTIADMSKLAAAVVRGWGLKPATRRAFSASQAAITSRQQFPTLLPEAAPEDRWPGLSSGLGVISFTGPQGRGFMKGGHNDSTANTMVCIEARRRCVVILSNDVRAEAAFPGLVETMLGTTGFPWAWEYPARQ
jgi:CubicO group peptidase (beta-lactamase class C family)